MARYEKPEIYRAFACGVLSEEKIQEALKILTFIFSYDTATKKFSYSPAYANQFLDVFTRCGSIDMYFETISNIWSRMMQDERREVTDRSLRVMSTGMAPDRVRSSLMTILYLVRVHGIQSLMNYLGIAHDPVCLGKPRFSASGVDYICYTLYEKGFYKRTFMNPDPEFNGIPTKPCIIFDASALEPLISIPISLIPGPMLKDIMQAAHTTKRAKPSDIDNFR